MTVTTARFIASSAAPDTCPRDGRPEYAFIGRSNVGKSSLINMLARRKGLAMTSATPGKTLLINHFLINEAWYIVDLPGYGYARRGLPERERLSRLIRGYLASRRELTCLFLAIDSRLTPQKIDLDFITWLGENAVPFALVFTKADKQNPRATQSNVEAFLEALSETWEELPPHFITSARKGLGREELLAYIEEINAGLPRPS